RRAQASALRETRFRELWDDEGYRLGESKGRFLVQRGAAEAGAPVPDELPYYLLLIGPPTEIPFDFQYELDVAYAVGRLDLPSSDAYAAYAQRVVAAERGEIGRAPGAGFWGPATQGDLATQLSSRFLLPPLADALTGHPVARLVGDAGSKAALRRLMGPEGPALLMTASHGAYVPRAADPAKHEAWAGALVTGDWVGQGPVGPDALLTAEDIAADDDLAGLVSVHFACFGAGTPRHDGFGLYRGKRVQRGQRDGVPQLPPELAAQPFSAPLIRKMLGHPRGSLAAIGHVDVSFASAFLRPGEQASHAGQLEPYRSLLAALMAGERVGRAMDWMHEKAADLAHGLAGQIHQVNENLASLDDPLRHTLADQWLKTLDARSYVVHGDPAVRLAHRDPARGPRESTPLTLVSPPPARDTPTDEIPTDVEFGFFDGGVGGKLKALGERVAGWLGQQLDDLGNLEVKTWSSPAEGLDPDAPRRLRAMTRIGLYGDA
ncbi:MAG: hypothetical protein KC613_18715, partial [Myxococcales bacterium]|nr:hypothetical protein [Myxococcales bacterium]